MTKEKALKELREAKQEFCTTDRWVTEFKVGSPALQQANSLRQSAYNRWIAALQRFNTLAESRV